MKYEITFKVSRDNYYAFIYSRIKYGIDRSLWHVLKYEYKQQTNQQRWKHNLRRSAGVIIQWTKVRLQWPIYIDHDGVSNHQPHDCLLNRLFKPRSKKTSKLRVTGLCAGNSPVTGEFPTQKASNAENVSTDVIMRSLTVGTVFSAANHGYGCQLDKLRLPWLPTVVYRTIGIVQVYMWLCNMYFVFWDSWLYFAGK